MSNSKKITYLKTLWGIDLKLNNSKELKAQLEIFKKDGFGGIELCTGFFDTKYKEMFNEARKEVGLKLITQIHTMGYPVNEESVDKHLSDYKTKVEDAKTWDPVLINSHSGRDSWNYEERHKFFTEIEKFDFSASNKDTIITHETHRRRVLCSPWIGNEIFNAFKKIKVTADLTNWTVVAERNMTNESDSYWDALLNNFAMRTYLIHARVGSPHQIQVRYPKDNCEDTEYFENIWKTIVNKTEAKEVFITLEYGPEPFAIPKLQANEEKIDLEETIKIGLERLKRKL